MKKLMIAAAIVCAAALSQAAQFKWQPNGSPAGALYAGSSATAYSKAGAVTLYLFDNDQVSQASLFTKVMGGTDISTLDNVTTTVLNNQSKPTAKEFDHGSIGNNYDYYFAAVFNNGTDDILYISSLQKDKACLESGTTSFQWTDLGNNSKSTITGATSFGSAGAYAMAVPEPTSGLLLLLGVAGLALRRRRA